MTTQEYWRNRMRLLEEARHQKNIQHLNALERSFRLEQKKIQTQIEAWYHRLAVNNEISMTEARQLLRGNALKEFRWTVEEYIKYGQENALDSRWMKELENASAKAHIRQLEALEIDLKHRVERIYGEYGAKTTELLSGHMQQVIDGAAKLSDRVSGSFSSSKVEAVLSKPWTSDGKTFSSRIWSQKEDLNDFLHRELTRMCIAGETPDRLIRDLQKKFDVSLSSAKRLVLTESAHVASVAQRQIYADLEVEKYEILAEIDSKTSDICLSLDGTVVDVKDYEEGVTAPPFHPNCRTITAPWFEDEAKLEAEDEPKAEKKDREYLVDFQIIHSKEYRDRVYRISENDQVNKSIHRSIKEILKHRNGTNYEDMYWIDGLTGKVLKRVVDSKIPSSVSYKTSEIRRMLRSYPNLITVHNHPSSLPPSVSDLVSSFRNGYELGVIAAHDGKLFIYSNNSGIISTKSIERVFSKYFERLKDEYQSWIATLNQLSTEGVIRFKEL